MKSLPFFPLFVLALHRGSVRTSTFFSLSWHGARLSLARRRHAEPLKTVVLHCKQRTDTGKHNNNPPA